MDEVTIQKIAAAVVRQLPNYAWVLLLVQGLITLVAAGAGAFFGEYFRTRGKNLATKADFHSLQEQLSATTQTVETIKSEVAQKDWARREWTDLRRTKLEALLTALHDCDHYLDRHGHKSAAGEVSIPERDPQVELHTIATLYFPELENEVLAFTLRYRAQILLGNVLVQELQKAGPDGDARQNAYNKYFAQFSPKEALEAAAVLKSAARRLLMEIMGVDEHQ